MSDLRISPVRSDQEMKEFIHFPWAVYRDDPYWVPPLLSERKEFHDPKRNPFFEHATVEYFIARRGSEPVGTIAAFTNDAYNEFQGVNKGFFGFFEVLDDAEAARALLDAAVAWVRDAGHDTILGPEMYTTNDEVGLLIEGFDDAPRVLMTYNPRRYMGYLEEAGFTKAMDLLAWYTSLKELAEDAPPKLLRVVDKVQKRRNLTVRNIRMKEFDEEVARFKVVYNSSWERNWGFVPLNDAEINYMAANLKQILDPDLMFMVEYEGEVVGASLTLPDLNAPLRLAYPRPGTPEVLTMLKLLWHWKLRPKAEWIRGWALGVLPEFRGLGIDAMMYLATARKAYEKGYKWVEMSWTLETNEMVNRSVKLLGGKLYKKHRLYEKRV